MLLEMFIIFFFLKQDFKNSFFPPTIIELNKLDHNLRNSSSFNIFSKTLLKFIRPSANVIISKESNLSLDCNWDEHKFKHSFQDSLNPFCSCCLIIESTVHFLLHCPMYITERHHLLSSIKNIDNNLPYLCEAIFIRTLLFGTNSFDTNNNTNVLNATIEYIILLKDLMNRFFNESRNFSNKLQISVFCVYCSS